MLARPQNYTSQRWLSVLEDNVMRHRRRLVRFGAVGVSGVIVNYLFLFLFGEVSGMNHIAAAAFASEISVLTNFALNDRWTFSDAAPSSTYGQRALQYNAVALAGMAISLGVLAGLTLAFGMQYMVANFFAIGAATLSNYTLNSRFTWGLPTAPATSLVPVPVRVQD